MSELYRCIGGGKTLQETVLWSNSSPTSSFAGQTVTLSDDMNNYDYLKIDFNTHATQASYGTGSAIFPVDYIKKTSSAASKPRFAYGAIRVENVSTRTCYYASDTTITIGSASQVGASGSNNSYLVPTAISGLKYASSKPSGTETILWNNSDLTSTFSQQDVTLSDSINNYSKLKFTFRATTTNTLESSVEISVSDFQSNNQSSGANNYTSFASPTVSDGSYGYVRRFWYVGPTTAHYYVCQKVNSQGSADTFNIPVSIKGIS